MMSETQWISIKERLPHEDETIEGRVPILDPDNYLGYAMLIDADGKNPWLLCEFDVAYWLPVPALKKV